VGTNSYDRSVAGTYGTLYLDSASGAYEFVADDAAIEGRTSDASQSFTLR
jgi:VCBS repeat-containing protein